MASIIIVEDEAIVAMEYKISLVRNGHVVLDIASSVDKALQAFHKQIPDLMLVDIKLKGDKDGLDFATEIRRFSIVPILFLSGNSDSLTMDKINNVTFSRFLSKPALTNKLNMEINEMLLLNKKPFH